MAGQRQRNQCRPQRMENMIKWLEVAREWERTATAGDHVQGRRETLLRDFAGDLKVDPSSVRRCSSALRFAEELVKAGKIYDVDALANFSLEKLTILQRVARLSMDEAAAMLGGNDTIRELRVLETALRAKLAGKAAALPGANLIVRRLGAPLFREAAVEAYLAAERAEGREMLRLPARGVFLDASHVLARTKPGGPFRAARMVPTPGLAPYPGRHSGIANLAGAVARIVERFDVVTESADDGERIAASLRKFGPCGAGVLHLSADGSLEEIHAASRLKPPDLLPVHVKDLDGRFPSSRGPRRSAAK